MRFQLTKSFTWLHRCATCGSRPGLKVEPDCFLIHLTYRFACCKMRVDEIIQEMVAQAGIAAEFQHGSSAFGEESNHPDSTQIFRFDARYCSHPQGRIIRRPAFDQAGAGLHRLAFGQAADRTPCSTWRSARLCPRI